MKFVYDLSRAPASFDFVLFLAVCATRAQGPFDLTILKGSKDGFRDDNLEPQSIDARTALLQNVVLPAVHLYPVRSLNLFPETGEGERPLYIYPGLYQELPVASLKVPQWARDYVQQRFPEAPVVICLRGAGYHGSRNSNVGAWKEAAGILRSRGHRVVVIPEFGETAHWAESFDPSNLILRTALQDHALITLGVNSGVMSLSWLNSNATYALLKLIAPTAATTEAWFENLGWAPGANLPFSYPNQRVLWEEDTVEAILKAFDETPKEKSGKDYFEPAKPFGRFDYVSRLNNTEQKMLEQAEINLARDTRLFIEQEGHNGKALIVGGGPSLDDTLLSLAVAQKQGGHIFALNGVHDFLIERGITPDYMVLLDTREENLSFLKKPNKAVKYLIASQCHPSIFEALEGYEVIQWTADMDGIEEVMKKSGRAKMSVGGGATVGMKAMYLSYLLGYRDLHFYGFDSSYRGSDNHAYKQALNDSEARIEVVANGRKFVCAPWMAKQAMEFQKQVRKLVERGCEISVHGDGLIPWVAKQLSTT
jgi:hypothetical protein